MSQERRYRVIIDGIETTVMAVSRADAEKRETAIRPGRCTFVGVFPEDDPWVGR